MKRRDLIHSVVAIGTFTVAGCISNGGTQSNATVDQNNRPTPRGEVVSEFVSSRTVEYQTDSVVTKSNLRYYDSEADELRTVAPTNGMFITCILIIENLGDKRVEYPSMNEFQYWTPTETFSLLENLPEDVAWRDLRQEGGKIREPSITKTAPIDYLTRTGPERVFLTYDVPKCSAPHYVKWSAAADPERNTPLYFEFQKG